MGNGILVFCEHDGGAFKRTSFELLSKGKELIDAIGGDLVACYIGDADGSTLGAYGAKKAFQVSGDLFDANNSGAAARALSTTIEKVNPTLVLASASPQGKDLFPRVSARLQAGLASEVTGLSIVDGEPIGRRPQFAGKAFSDVRIKSAIKMFTVRANSFTVSEASGDQASVENVSVDLDDIDNSYKQTGMEKSTAAVADLTEADRIVSGGRSVKSKEKFDSLIRPLAAAIGATPGASRAAVDAGYAGHSDQVGQTGKVVNPSLYIACGISGAIQHLAGMRTSRVIVAINKDKDAPIFNHATYGIVADMFDVCPVLTDALKGDAPLVVPQATVHEKAEPKPAAKEAAPVKKATTEAAKPKAAPVKTSKPTEAKPVFAKKPESSKPSASVTPSGGAVVTAAFDPALLDGLKEQVRTLQDEVKSLRSDLTKALKDNEKTTKQEIQRVEQNARSFQQGGLKRYDDLDGKIVNEVRKVRETLRKGIHTDTEEIREGMTSLRSMVTSATVINIIVMIIALITMVKVLMV